jgi:hypothetical protein
MVLVALVCLVLVLGGVGLVVLLVKKLTGMRKEVDAARAEFLQRTGYAYVSALTLKANPTRQKDTQSGRFTHYFEVYSEGAKRITAQSWQLDSRVPPRVPFQVVDRKLVGAMRAFLNVVGPTKRTLTIAYPGPYPTGDAEFDARFAVYSPDMRGACAIVLQPDLRRALLQLATVSLLVDGTGASFGDPSDDNVYGMGASRTDVSPAPAIRAAANVHQAVEYVLNRAVGA